MDKNKETNNNQHLEDMGWNEMNIALDQEMPRRKYRFLWLLFFFGLIGGIAYVIYSNSQDVENDIEQLFNEPIAQNIDVITIQKTKKSNAILNHTHSKNIEKSQISDKRQVTIEDRILNAKIDKKKVELKKPQRSNEIFDTKAVMISDKVASKNTNYAVNQNRAMNSNFLGKVSTIDHIPTMRSSEKIISNSNDKIIEIKLAPLDMKSGFNKFLTNPDRKWHPFICTQIGINPKFDSRGLGIGLGMSYEFNQRISILFYGKYQNTNYNTNGFFGTNQLFDLNSSSNQWHAQNNSSNKSYPLDRYILRTNNVELYMGLNYRWHSSWSLSGSVGITSSNDIGSSIVFDYEGILRNGLYNKSIRKEELNVSKITQQYENGTLYNVVIPIADLQFTWHFSIPFSTSIGFTKYFNSIIKEVNIASLKTLESGIDASNFYINIKYQI